MIKAKLLALSVEELANTITHGFGLFLSVIGFTAGSHILPGDAEAMKAAGAKMIADDFEDVADWIGWVS